MRRFRYIYNCTLLLAVSLLMALSVSCSREDIDFSEKIPISFTSSVDNSTKALISDVAGIQTTGFGVTAYINQNSSWLPVMNNQKVVYSGGKWGYSPVSYWSKNDSYTFAAYAPYGSATVNLSVATMTFADVPRYQNVMTDAEKANAKDILTDVKSGSYNSEFRNGEVQFELKHELAYLEIRAVKADIASMRDVTFKVASLTLGDAQDKMASTGNCTFVKGILDNNKTTWGTTSYTGDGKYTIIGSLLDTPIPNEVDKNPLVLSQMLIAPFEFGGTEVSHSLPFNIRYNKNDGKNTPSNHDIKGHAITIKKFEAGKKYIVTLRFNTASKVEINTVVVEDWTAGTTYEPPVFNW